MMPKEIPMTKPRKKKKDLEGPVVRECLQFLKQHSDVIYVERRNTGAVKFQGGGFLRFGSKGAADIWCLIEIPKNMGFVQPATRPPDTIVHMARTLYPDDCLHSLKRIEMFKGTIIHIEIECKRADGQGRQSPDQKKFQEFCYQNNIPYFLVTNVQQLAIGFRGLSS